MDDRAEDIKELEQILDGGGSYDELSEKAIEIGRRIVGEAEQYGRANDFPEKEFDRLFKESHDLGELIKEITRRRGKKALERYDAWEEAEMEKGPTPSFFFEHQKGRRGANCDVYSGPCACGAWHRPRFKN